MSYPMPYASRESFEAQYPNVKGTAIREPIDGTDRKFPVLVVLVTRKVAESDLDDEEIVPDLVHIDGQTYETDVHPVGIPHLTSVTRGAYSSETTPEDHQARHRPIPGGTSIGNSDVGAGTMGSPLLEHKATGDPVVLTNAHVSGGADEQFQPASLDGGAHEEPFGFLREASPLNPDKTQRTDSALIDVDPQLVDDVILGIGELVGFDEPEYDRTHTKAGRTTAVTESTLKGRDASVRVAYGDKTIRFEGCDVFGHMSEPGDSGSLIGYEDSEGFHATDLLFAGSDRATIAIPLSTVFEYHGELVVPSDEDDGGDGDGDEDNGGDDDQDQTWGQFRYQARLATGCAGCDACGDRGEAVIDGDTIDVTLDQGFNDHKVDQRLRILDVDTAERGDDMFDEHREFVADWLTDAAAEYNGEWPLIVDTKEDQQGTFGRWLADVWRKSDGQSLAVALHNEFGDDILHETVPAPATDNLRKTV